MEQRYATSPEHVPGMDTAELRRRYLVQDLFRPDEVGAVYTHHDRVVLLGVTPVSRPLDLPTFPEIRSEFFLEHREAGVINVGGTGTVTADGATYTLTKGSCLYVGRGVQGVTFASEDGADPAAFYVMSAPPTRPTRRRSSRPARATSASSATSSRPTVARSTSTSTRTA